ncbi:PhzF family phenazine biosynthesis protein [Erythrobacter sp.]|uniref:PhzF family phenazine biosynthesis protein n=1 Tax=Erythrobacter sp. TaxID=1042 RepID=UPI001425FB84|nr:PhzF family phenazine biosynthesis protein [Erythrobacter sp.]QIQ87562.1 MAG: PhzF family phenazine biosynthesis protein [Erythrobacter sp.]
MTDTIPYWHVDAFAAQPFAGNQAAVMVLDEWLPDEVLQQIGEENNFAETAFVVRDRSGEADWELRWFTPTDEVALCGHATLASGHVLLSDPERFGHDRRVTFRTRRAGILEVVKADAGYELALPVTLVERASHPDLLGAIGFRGEVFLSWYGAEQTAIVAMQSEAEIRGLAPDMTALRGIDLMAICTAPADEGSDYDVVSRVFVPAWGVDEDSVTGSAHAALAPFWAERLGKLEMRAHQASSRGGDLTMRLEGEGKDQRAWLGGPCVTVVEGAFRL